MADFSDSFLKKSTVLGPKKEAKVQSQIKKVKKVKKLRN